MSEEIHFDNEKPNTVSTQIVSIKKSNNSTCKLLYFANIVDAIRYKNKLKKNKQPTGKNECCLMDSVVFDTVCVSFFNPK